MRRMPNRFPPGKRDLLPWKRCHAPYCRWVVRRRPAVWSASGEISDGAARRCARHRFRVPDPCPGHRRFPADRPVRAQRPGGPRPRARGPHRPSRHRPGGGRGQGRARGHPGGQRRGSGAQRRDDGAARRRHVRRRRADRAADGRRRLGRGARRAAVRPGRAAAERALPGPGPHAPRADGRPGHPVRRVPRPGPVGPQARRGRRPALLQRRVRARAGEPRRRRRGALRVRLGGAAPHRRHLRRRQPGVAGHVPRRRGAGVPRGHPVPGGHGDGPPRPPAEHQRGPRVRDRPAVAARPGGRAAVGRLDGAAPDDRP